MNTFPDLHQYRQMLELFQGANERFLGEQENLIASRVSERTLCGQLMIYLNDRLRRLEGYDRYYVDVEYNRNFNRQIKRILNHRNEAVSVTCDLIVHSRGEVSQQDNLVAIEMKKVKNRAGERSRTIMTDQERLKALTRPSYDNDWHFDGYALPEYICRYVLGVYYQINYHQRTIWIQYYRNGEVVDEQTIEVNI
ncbi:hypothetical protein [Exiguobacterium algae]|uniref:hypothetical protein n=1 Tax=Exiguobacterium algae TaxID=2751250 RepID=UPI001BEC2B83|nr:hypothetical protein [Exiguobacterium algae]